MKIDISLIKLPTRVQKSLLKWAHEHQDSTVLDVDTTTKLKLMATEPQFGPIMLLEPVAEFLAGENIPYAVEVTRTKVTTRHEFKFIPGASPLEHHYNMVSADLDVGSDPQNIGKVAVFLEQLNVPEVLEGEVNQLKAQLHG